jgi:hypothetical protein
MARYDVVTVGSIGFTQRNCAQSGHIVRTAAGVWYRIFPDAGGAIQYTKSTNYGLTWSVAVSIKASVVVRGYSVWFDKWTPSDTGTVIHIAYMESTNHDVFYRALDTASDTLGTEITVFAGASAGTGADICISVTKSKAGRILVGFDLDGGTETGFYKSDDFPVTAFTSKNNSGGTVNFNEGVTDYYQLFPGNEADTADIWCVFWDRTADEISLKIYDDSANDWVSETSIAGTMADVAASLIAPQFSGAIRRSDGHLILVAWSAADTLNADLRCWDINGAASITEKTNVVQNSTDDQAACAIGIDEDSDTLYCFYFGKSDGSETYSTSMNVWYKGSADGGTTWAAPAETQATSAARSVYQLDCSPTFTSGEYVVSWFASAGLVNTLYSSAYVAASGGGARIIGG